MTDRPSDPDPSRKGPVRALMLVLIVLIGYGSMFPFQYVPHVPSWRDPLHLLVDWPWRISLSDAVGNVLLFAPFGLLVPLLSRRPLVQFGWLVGGAVFAWLMQYVQFWFPGRDPSASDAAFNCVGIALGWLTAVATRRLGHGIAPRFDKSHPLWRVASALMLLWLAYRWFPWAPTLDVQNMVTGLKPLFAFGWHDPPRVLHDTAAWLLWFWLARHCALPVLARSPPALICAAAIVLAEPLFVGNAVSLANVCGLALAMLLRARLAAHARPPWALLLLVAASLVVSGLAPHAFGHPHRFLWLPFAGMLQGNMVLNTASLIEKCFIYGGALVLLWTLGFRWLGAGLLLATLLAAIEWTQRYLPGRTAEVTDPILALLLALCFTAAQTPQERDQRA